ncbi:MAG TPA: substrate-binding domain-containing protein, partial [Verrucomicrobiae bacterium]|nr:substrate-binding domain-containing protein [Verrucomicrobiae bacterium]
EARKIPVILLGPNAPFCSRFFGIDTGDLLGSYAVTQHLLKLGHRKIAFLAGPPAATWAKDRFEGYRRALREVDLEVDESLVFQSGTTIEDGLKTALQMMNENCTATAVQAINDLVAIGCANAYLTQGVTIPDDLSIAGYGNLMTAEHYRIPLTTVRQPKARLGHAAMDMMQQLLRGQKPEIRRLTAEISIRDSTGRPKQTKE